MTTRLLQFVKTFTSSLCFKSCLPVHVRLLAEHTCKSSPVTMRDQTWHRRLWHLALSLLIATHGATAELTPAQFFPWEKVVATNGALAPGYSQYEKYFAFANSSSAPQQPLNGSCKVFPGDAAWPSPEVWQFFNDKLDGRLIKTVPLAHDCYNTAWGDYDASQCAYIAANWNNSYLQ